MVCEVHLEMRAERKQKPLAAGYIEMSNREMFLEY